MVEKKGMNFWRRNAERFMHHYTSPSLVDKLFRGGMYLREKKALEIIDETPGATVLDLGCGPGKQVIEAVKRGASLAVGVDFAPEMLMLAKQAAQKDGIGERVEFNLSDFLSYHDNRTFDIVWAFGVFDYTADPDELVQVMARYSDDMIVASFRRKWVLRYPIRKLWFAIQGREVYFYSKREIESLFRRNGIRDIKIKVLEHAVYFVTGRV